MGVLTFVPAAPPLRHGLNIVLSFYSMPPTPTRTNTKTLFIACHSNCGWTVESGITSGRINRINVRVIEWWIYILHLTLNWWHGRFVLSFLDVHLPGSFESFYIFLFCPLMEATQTNVLSADISQPGTHTHNRTEAEATNELLGPLAACRSFLLLSKESAWVVRVGGERERRMKSGRLNGFYYGSRNNKWAFYVEWRRWTGNWRDRE